MWIIFPFLVEFFTTMIAFKYTSCELMTILVFLQFVKFPKVRSQLLHFLRNYRSQWSHLDILVADSWLFCASLKLLHSQTFYHNCCMTNFLFQVKEGHYLSTNFIFSKQICFGERDILFLKMHHYANKYICH